MTWRPWPSPRRPWTLEVLLPGSVLSTEQDLRDKTYKAGFISRALAIFRVDVVTIYSDDDTVEEDKSLLSLLLRYQVTPPHLKRRALPMRSELRFAGLMPPLNLPNHRPPREAVPGAVMDGLVTSAKGGSCEVYLGELGLGTLTPCEERPGSIVTVSINSSYGGELQLARASWGDLYVGYRVREGGYLTVELERLRSEGFAVVGTSRYGSTNYAALSGLEGRPVAVVVGGPREGLLQYVNLKSFDVVLNTVPRQGTETVRSEEALLSTLAIVSAFLSG